MEAEAERKQIEKLSGEASGLPVFLLPRKSIIATWGNPGKTLKMEEAPELTDCFRWPVTKALILVKGSHYSKVLSDMIEKENFLWAFGTIRWKRTQSYIPSPELCKMFWQTYIPTSLYSVLVVFRVAAVEPHSIALFYPYEFHINFSVRQRDLCSRVSHLPAAIGSA